MPKELAKRILKRKRIKSNGAFSTNLVLVDYGDALPIWELREELEEEKIIANSVAFLTVGELRTLVNLLEIEIEEAADRKELEDKYNRKN